MLTTMKYMIAIPNEKRQRIQVERLMLSVIAFVITVDWLHCEANCQTLLGGDDIILSEKRRVVLSMCVLW